MPPIAAILIRLASQEMTKSDHGMDVRGRADAIVDTDIVHSLKLVFHRYE